MHPAPSIIIFSTLSGAGFGLIVFLSLLPPPAGIWPFLLSAVFAIGLCMAGLVSSTYHLGHRERAWRALTQWRSSWLSREGVLSLATLAFFSTYIGLAVVLDRRIPVLGAVTALLAACSVYATGMIYASLRAVPAWHDRVTPLTYLAFSAASGAILSLLISLLAGVGAELLSWVALASLPLAWAIKFVWWSRASRKHFGGSTPESATGLGPLGRVRLFEAPHTSPNYLMKEMVFRVGRKHAAKLRIIALLIGGVLPALFLVGSLSAGGNWPLALLAAISHLAGLLAERWLFFAEAEHLVALYYGYGERA